MHTDFYNPYENFLLKASAGSGKTYQLSYRYFYLVMAGTPVEGILALTFTTKAATEMRLRILKIACHVLSSETDQAIHDKDMLKMWKRTEKTKKPLSAKKAAEKILVESQALKILTMDSLFYLWGEYYPLEFWMPEKELEQNTQKLLSQYDEWQLLLKCRECLLQEENLIIGEEQNDLFALYRQLSCLVSLSEYLWFSEKAGGNSNWMHPHPIPKKDEKLSSEITNHLREDFKKISMIKKDPEIIDIWDQQDFAALKHKGLLTKNSTISKRYLQGKKREELYKHIEHVEETLRIRENVHRLKKLNKNCVFLYNLYKLFDNIKNKQKKIKNFFEFSDLIQGAFRLFHEEKSAGIRFAIHREIHHLLIDEFQDTSLNQWSVFQLIIAELLAGSGVAESFGSIPPTVFLVGDIKQSIYGFRGANPAVVHAAKEKFEAFGLQEKSMATNYRSSQIILDFVNKLFLDHQPLQDFIPHNTADIFHPSFVSTGQVHIADLIDSDTDLSSVEKEAECVTSCILKLLDNPHQFPLYDKTQRHYRPLRLGDITILYRSSTHLDLFEEAFSKAGLAAQRLENKGLFDQIEIQDFLAFFRLAIHPEDRLSWLHFLKSFFINLNISEKFLEIMSQKDFHHQISQWIISVQADLWACICDLRHQIHQTPPYEMALKVYQTFQCSQSLHAKYDKIVAEKIEQCFLRLFELIFLASTEGYLNSWQQLPSFCQRYQREGYPDKLEDQALHLLTIHKAKGLEFPVVFLIDAANAWHKRDPFWIKPPTNDIGLYYIGSKEQWPQNDTHFERLLNHMEEKQREESLRLLYVALTRAEQYLFISGHQPRKDKKKSFYPSLLAAANDLPEGVSSKKWTICGYSMTSWERKSKNLSEQRLQNFAPSPLKKLPYKIPFVTEENTKNMRLPNKWQVLSPYKQINLQNTQTSSSELSPWHPHERIYGLVIHYLLESFIKKNPCTTSQVFRWMSFHLSETICWSKKQKNQLIQEAYQESVSCLESRNWKQLFHEQEKIYSEHAIVGIKDTYFIRGVIDLLIKKKKSCFWLIDFKTTRSLPSHDAQFQDLPSSYQEQLSQYKSVLQKIKQNYPIYSGVFFTMNQQLILSG